MPPIGPLSPEQIGVIKAWIDQGAEWPDELAGDAPTSGQDHKAVLLIAVLHRGDRGAFEKLVRDNPNSVDAKGREGSTPLMYAAWYGDAGSVRLLLKYGADPNASNDAGATALMWAVDDSEKARLLLERGADANARSQDGATPILLAASKAWIGRCCKAAAGSRSQGAGLANPWPGGGFW